MLLTMLKYKPLNESVKFSHSKKASWEYLKHETLLSMVTKMPIVEFHLLYNLFNYALDSIFYNQET
jgi:hypothetical protein